MVDIKVEPYIKEEQELGKVLGKSGVKSWKIPGKVLGNVWSEILTSQDQKTLGRKQTIV